MGDQPRPFNGDNGEWAFPSGKELGPLLKAKREEMGLAYGQISAQIKVSQRYLEALENEAWDRLPSPAFVKGFIRSYARVLGLSEDALVALYQEIAPPPQPLTRPIQTPPPRKRGLFYLILVLAVLAAGIAAYRWTAQSNVGGKPTQRERAVPAEKRSDSKPPEPREQPSGRTDTDHAKSQGPSVTTTESKTTGHPGPAAEVPPPAAEGAVSSKNENPPAPDRPVPNRDQASESGLPPLVLKALVRERTWIRVIIDGQKPKESTFNPETHLEWRAHEGFELLIGNAGGVELELNGEKLGPPGKRGQVVKLRLPSAEKMSVSGE